MGSGRGDARGVLVSGAGQDAFDWLGRDVYVRGAAHAALFSASSYFPHVPELEEWGGVSLPRLEGGGDPLEKTCVPGAEGSRAEQRGVGPPSALGVAVWTRP